MPAPKLVTISRIQFVAAKQLLRRLQITQQRNSSGRIFGSARLGVFLAIREPISIVQ
jgi:hypothetical protein